MAVYRAIGHWPAMVVWDYGLPYRWNPDYLRIIRCSLLVCCYTRRFRGGVLVLPVLVHLPVHTYCTSLYPTSKDQAVTGSHDHDHQAVLKST
jgi:hypothetical protein